MPASNSCLPYEGVGLRGSWDNRHAILIVSRGNVEGREDVRNANEDRRVGNVETRADSTHSELSVYRNCKAKTDSPSAVSKGHRVWILFRLRLREPFWVELEGVRMPLRVMQQTPGSAISTTAAERSVTNAYHALIRIIDPFGR